MSIFTKEVLEPVQEALNGNPTLIPIHLDRVSECISIRQSIYTLIGGNTGQQAPTFREKCSKLCEIREHLFLVETILSF